MTTKRLVNIGRTSEGSRAAAEPPPKGMRWIPMGEFAMGSDDFYPEEAPVTQVALDGFWIDERPLTVAEFRRFVRATGPRHGGRATFGSRALSRVGPRSLGPRRARVPSRRQDPSTSTTLRTGGPMFPARAGASRGPGLDPRRQRPPPGDPSSVRGCRGLRAVGRQGTVYRGGMEDAARPGPNGAVFTWANEFMPKGKVMANTWHGEFPWQRLSVHRYERTSPVASFPPNGYGLYDMAGNVWEWTDRFLPAGSRGGSVSCCGPRTLA